MLILAYQSYSDLLIEIHIKYNGFLNVNAINPMSTLALTVCNLSGSPPAGARITHCTRSVCLSVYHVRVCNCETIQRRTFVVSRLVMATGASNDELYVKIFPTVFESISCSRVKSYSLLRMTLFVVSTL